MVTLHLLVLLVAALCFLFAAFRVTAKVDLIAAGLFCWIVSQFVRL